MNRIILCVSVVVLLSISGPAYAQSNIKTWTETLLQDFSDNKLTNLVVTNSSGGEVQFPHPLIKILEDYVDNSALRFISRDSTGNYVRAWTESRNVYVQKYSAAGEELSPVLRVNEIDQSIGEYDYCCSSLMNDGVYIVVWLNAGTDHSMVGQIFKDDSIRVGTNFIIKSQNEHNNDPPKVMSNNSDNNFWVFYSRIISEKFKIQVQKVSKTGSNVGSATILNQENITLNEFGANVCSSKNYFWIGWTGDNNNCMDDDDELYLQRFDYDGTPIDAAVIVNDDSIGPQISPSLCLDDDQNLFITWSDGRDAIEPIYSIKHNIYGQVFNEAGTKIGNNIRLNSTKINQYIVNPFINYNYNEFQLSWLWLDENTKQYYTYANKWMIDLKLSGEMTSSVYCADPDSADFETISWNNAFVPQTDIKFKMRTGQTIEQLNNSCWYGPTDTSDYYISSGSTINPIHDNNCYIQYKVLFNSLYGNSPVLNSVSIKYLPSDSIAPSPPASLTATPSLHKIKLAWQSNNQNDLLEYILYRGTKSGQYDSTWKAFTAGNILTFEDNTVVIGPKYFYVVTAADSSHNESICSNEISATAFGVNLYVSALGNLNGDGSINDPFLTIQQGIAAAVPGDTVRILPGNYNQSFNMRNRVSLLGTDVEQCKISTKISAADSCTIKGLTITQSLSCMNVSPQITENIFLGHFPYWPTIDLGYSASPIISKNFITECITGIYGQSDCDPLIKNNIIKASEYGIAIGGLGFFKPKIINNTVIAKKYYAASWWSWDTVIVMNNILVTLDQDALGFPGEDPYYPAKIEYNDFWNAYQVGTQVPATNIFLNPQFENYGLQNYHLQPTSPCLDAGNPDPIYNDVDGSRNDMGAYGGPDPILDVLSSQLTKSIYVSNLSAYPQDTTHVFITLDNTAGLAKADFVLEYDPALLAFLKAELTTATQNFTLNHETQSTGMIAFSIFAGAPVESPSGDILQIEMIVKASAQTGDASSLILKNVALFDVNLKKINLRSITDGTFIVNMTQDNENYIHVDANYEGIENGSREHPFNTIGEAIAVAGAGDSILVSSGDYLESVMMKEGVAVIGSSAAVTNLIVSADQTGVVFENVEQGEISGFTLKGLEDADPGTPLILCTASSPLIKKNRLETALIKDAGISCAGNSNAVIENNYIKRMAVAISESAPLIRNNVIEDFIMNGIGCCNGSAAMIDHNIIQTVCGGDAIYISESNPVVKNNFIYSPGGLFSVFIYNSNNPRIYNNIIIDKNGSCSGIRILNSSAVEIINNAILTHYQGIMEESSESIIFNNIVSGNSQFGMQLSAGTNSDYNDVWNNALNYSGISPGTNDITTDPLFADTLKGDYRLGSGSLCINYGNPDPAYNDPDGTRNDLGAYGGPYADYNWLPISSGSVTIDSVSVNSTDTIVVAISGKQLENIIEFDFALSYDKALLTMVNANNTDLTKCFTLEKDFDDPGVVDLYLKSNLSSYSQDGEVVKLYFVSSAKQSVETWIQLDSAKVKNEATYQRNIYNLGNGKIKITVSDIRDLTIDNSVPRTFRLYQNYPNPFNPATMIKYEIPTVSKVSIRIFDILGREVMELFNGRQQAGRYEIEWQAAGVASGIYFYNMRAGNFCATRKLILLR